MKAPYSTEASAKDSWRLAGVGLWIVVTATHLLGWEVYCLKDAPSNLYLFSYASSLMAILLGWQLWTRARSARLGPAATLLMQVFQIAGLASCASLLSSNEEHEYFLTPPGHLVVQSFVTTDKGNQIPLYVRQVKPEELSKFYEATSAHVSSLARQAMFRDGAKPQVNCHGWVFNGNYIVKGDDVPTILRENGYSTVTKPQLSDLVVYRDPKQNVVHTGVVCGLLADEMVLVESKWGICGTYMHLADEQPYSHEYKFYRSPRQGHRLDYCDRPGEALVATSRSHASAADLVH